MTMVEATILVVAVAKMYLAWLLLRQAHGMTRAMHRMKGAMLPPAAAAQLKRQVLTEVAKQKAVQV